MDDERTLEQAPEEIGEPLAAPEPARLTLAMVTDSGRALLLRDQDGREFTLEITPLLRTSVHGGTPRRSETKMNTSSLRPRDIQNRIRSGESPESVAEAAGTTLESIMSYVAPVVAEREHVAATAQRASLRRGPGEPTTPPINRVLGDAVEGHLRSLGARPEDVTWDAYRRETGRWVLTATYAIAGRSATATFTYDAPGNYALTDDDEARWLIGEQVQPQPVIDPVDDLQQIRQRRMAAAGAGDLPLGGALGDDAIGLVDGAAATPPPGEIPLAPPAPADADAPLPFDEPLRSTTPPAATAPAVEAGSDQTDAEAEESAEAARHRRQAQKKRGRASVPSWDEIMFGPTGD